MRNLSNASSTLSAEMKEVQDLVLQADFAKHNFITAKQLLGDGHSLVWLAQQNYTQAVSKAMDGYRTMADHMTEYMDAVLA